MAEGEGDAEASAFSLFFFALPELLELEELIDFFLAPEVDFLAPPFVELFFSIWVEEVVVELPVSVLLAQPLIKIAAAAKVDRTTKWVFMALVSHGKQGFDKTNPGASNYFHPSRK